MERVKSFYSLPMTVVIVGMVGNALQSSLGCNPGCTRRTLASTMEMGVRPNHGLVQSSPFSAGGHLDFFSLQTCEFWPNWSCHLWVLVPFIDKSDSRHRSIDWSPVLMSIPLHFMFIPSASGIFIIKHKYALQALLVLLYFGSIDGRNWSLMTVNNRLVRTEPISVNAYTKRTSGIKYPFIMISNTTVGISYVHR